VLADVADGMLPTSLDFNKKTKKTAKTAKTKKTKKIQMMTTAAATTVQHGIGKGPSSMTSSRGRKEEQAAEEV
jgi:hypothetical protein